MSHTLFDYNRSQADRREGMRKAADKKSEWLGFFRQMAVQVATTQGGYCDSDTLARFAWEHHRMDMSHILGNASGSLFLGKQWEFTGRYTKATRKRSRGREVKVWRLKQRG